MSKVAYCDSCGKHIPPVFKERPEISVNDEAISSHYSNLEGGLRIYLRGSYGEYYDFLGSPRAIILCRLCSNHLHNLLMEKFGIDPYKLELTSTLTEEIEAANE